MFLASKFQRRLEVSDWLMMEPDLDPIKGTKSTATSPATSLLA
jgi:hypothetical protein